MKSNRYVSYLKVFTFISLITIMFTCNAVEFARPVSLSWKTLQNKNLDLSSSKIELKLADICPANIVSSENFYKNKVVSYGYIFFSNYYWTEYRNNFDEICIVKQSNFDLSISDIEVLSKEKSKLLLKVNDLYGFNNETKKILNIHLLLQKRAIRELETLKYGGPENVRKFIESNPVEVGVTKPNYTEREKKLPSTSITLVQYLESKYSSETLNTLIKSVALSPPNRLSNGKYPFTNIEYLILEAKADVNNGLLTIDQIFNSIKK